LLYVQCLSDSQKNPEKYTPVDKCERSLTRKPIGCK
jgi:hypothetical protein